MEFVHGLGDSGTPGSTSSSPPAGSNSSSPPKRIWDGMEHGINNQPKRMPAYLQPPPVYNRFAAGGGRPRMLRLPEPSDLLAHLPGRQWVGYNVQPPSPVSPTSPPWANRQSVANRHFSGQSSTAMRNPFEVGRSPISTATQLFQQQQHINRYMHMQPLEEPSPPPSNRSVGAASTVFMAAGTEWQSAPESQRSLGGFSVVFDDAADRSSAKPTLDSLQQFALVQSADSLPHATASSNVGQRARQQQRISRLHGSFVVR